jgi:TRL-like protein family
MGGLLTYGSMMKKFWLCALGAGLLTGCVYSNIRVPLDEDLWKTELGSKVGTASNYSVLWLFAWGDAGVKRAAENGGLTTINHMDMGVESYLFGAYIRRDTIVYGD